MLISFFCYQTRLRTRPDCREFPRKVSKEGLIVKVTSSRAVVVTSIVPPSRRLQTQVYKSGLAKSIHHARVLIRQRHIRVGKQIVNVPSFVVRLDSQKHIDFALTSPYGGARAGRVKRKRERLAASKEGGDEGGEEEEE